MSTRATRRGNNLPVDTSAAFSNIEALILAQAVWEHGASSWQTVAKVLTKHPLISRPKSFFTAQLCHLTYDTLMKEAGLEQSEANNSPHAPVNHKLAEKHFRKRFEELRELIIAEETQFKTIVSEIEQIRAGQWDTEITTLGTPTSQPELPTEPEESPPTEEPISQEKALQTLRAEVFDGSDLSVTTNTPSSSKSHDDLESKDMSNDSKVETPKTLEAQGVEVTTPTTVSSNVALGSVRILNADVGTPDEDADILQGLVDEEPSPTPLPITIDSKEDIQAVSAEEGTEAHEEIYLIHVGETEEKEANNETAEQDEDEEPEGIEEMADQAKNQMNEKQLAHNGQQTTESTHTLPSDPESVSDVIESTSLRHATRESELRVRLNEDRAAMDSPEVATSPEPVAEDVVTSGDEPLQTRRSTRRRSSAHPPPIRMTKSRRQKIVSTEAVTTPPLTLDEDVEADPGVDTNDTDAFSEGQPMDGDDERLSSMPHESSVATRRRDAKRKASAVENVESPREKKRPRDESEPVDEDDTGTNSNSRTRRRGDRTEEQAALKRFQNVIIMLHTQISQHRNGNIFHNPIKTSEAPDYHEIVKQPTDLKKIKMKIKDGTISNSLEFKREIFHMFANAMMYNRPGSDVYVMAEDMMLESEVQIETFRQTEGLVRGVHRI